MSTVRAAVVVALLSALAAAPATAHSRGASWTVAQAMRAVDDVRVRVGAKVVRIDSDTSLCSGEGPSIRRGKVRAWTHFRCTSTTFTSRGPGRDLEFRLHALDVRRFRITNAGWVGWWAISR